LEDLASQKKMPGTEKKRTILRVSGTRGPESKKEERGASPYLKEDGGSDDSNTDRGPSGCVVVF